MSRWRNLVDNLGRWGTARLLFVALVLPPVVAMMVRSDPGRWWPVPLAMLAGATGPLALRRTLLERFETSRTLLQASWVVLMGGVVLGQTLLRESPWGIAALFGLAAAVMSATFLMASDPSVRRVRD